MTICVICRSAEQDELRFGNMVHVSARVAAHEKCMLLTIYKDAVSILGPSNFTETEVLVAKSRTESMLCEYCGERGANLVCAHYNCEIRYHTGCGINHNALNSFLGEIYLSYCERHVECPTNIPSTDANCNICLQDLRQDGEEFNPVKMVQSPCCLNGWYHWQCMQQYALSSAVSFKCPLCNNARRFRDITYWGIYVPWRLPSWESEPGAYGELYQRIHNCAAPQCPQPNGPSAILGALIDCNRCGSNPMHSTCIPRNAMAYTCESCNLGSLLGYQPPTLEAEEEAVNLQLSFVGRYSLPNFLNLRLRRRSHDSLSISTNIVPSLANATVQTNVDAAQATNDENASPNLSARRRLNIATNALVNAGYQLRSNATGSRLQNSPKQSSPARSVRSRSINRRRQTHNEAPRLTGSDEIIDLTLTDDEAENMPPPVYNLRSTRTIRNPLVNQQLNNIGANSPEDVHSKDTTINSPISSRTRAKTRRGNQENSVADTQDPLSPSP